MYSIYLKHPQICTDTRKIIPGCLFFCLKGENFDGNRFATQALEQGASYVVTENTELTNHPRCIVVQDSLKALQELAAEHRRNLEIPVIGITGTNGKTTTKELIAIVLKTKFKISFTQGNFNNHIGVPLTLLSIPADTEIAIVEMGANHPGEIADLCQISQPTYGVITTIGKAHLEGFGSEENIIKTKSALYESVIKRNGTLFVNGGDAVLTKCAERATPSTTIIKYGKCEGSTCDGEIVDMNPYLAIKVGDVTFRTHLTGDYNLVNILCAIAIGKHFGISESAAAEAISNYVPTNNRSQINQVGSNVVIADFYNANPTSMKAAILNLAHLAHPNKKAILGDMLELGHISEEEHRHIVELCKAQNIDAFFVGENFAALQIPGMKVFPNVEALNDYLQQHPFADSMILIKGSHSIHLDKAVVG